MHTKVPGVTLGADTNFVHYTGHDLSASYAQLVALLGPHNSEGDKYKVTTAWELTFTTKSGEAQAVYLSDRKQTFEYDSDLWTVEEMRRSPRMSWMVRGRGPYGLEEFVEVMKTAINSLGVGG